MLRSRGDNVSSTPHLAPAVFGHQPLKFAVEVIDVRQRAVHIGITQHLAPLDEPAVVENLIHSYLCPPLDVVATLNPGINLEIRQPFQCRQARHEHVLAAAQHVERVDAVNSSPHRRLGNRERSAFSLQAHNWVAFLAKPRKISVVNPFPLQEFQGSHRFGADEKEIDPVRDFIIALRKCVRVIWRSVGCAAPNNAMDVHVCEHGHLRIAWVHPAHMAAARHLFTFLVAGIIEVVVSLRVLAECGVVLEWRQRQRRAAAPTADKLRCQEFTFFVRSGIVSQESIECSD